MNCIPGTLNITRIVCARVRSQVPLVLVRCCGLYHTLVPEPSDPTLLMYSQGRAFNKVSTRSLKALHGAVEPIDVGQTYRRKPGSAEVAVQVTLDNGSLFRITCDCVPRHIQFGSRDRATGRRISETIYVHRDSTLGLDRCSATRHC